jgi:hypothetical protein
MERFLLIFLLINLRLVIGLENLCILVSIVYIKIKKIKKKNNMGHKVNAFSFRIRKSWDSLYFFKNRYFLNSCIIQDIRLREYINQVCFHQKKFVYSFKIFRCSKSLFIFFKFLNFLVLDKRFKKSFYIQKLINLKLKKKKKKISTTFQKYKKLPYIKNLKKHLSDNICSFFKIEKVFIFCFLGGLPKKQNSRFLKIFFKKDLYRKNFKNISNLILISLINKSSKVLSLGISEFFKKLIRHNQFLRILSKALFIYSKFFYSLQKKKLIRGYRVEIKGKMNGRLRKKKRIISSGRMPFSSVNSNISYFFSESFTKYGIFGVKVWLFF